MIPFFTLLLCAVAFCVGVYALTREGSVFGELQKVVRKPSGELRFILAKPLSECLTCSSSLYGTIIYGTYFGFRAQFNFVLLVLFSLIIFSIVGEIFSKTEAQKEANQKLQRCFYITFIAYSCLIFYQERFLEAIMFLVCLSGCNYFVDCLLASIKCEIEYRSYTMQNQIDQAQAVEEICEAIKSASNKTEK